MKQTTEKKPFKKWMLGLLIFLTGFTLNTCMNLFLRDPIVSLISIVGYGLLAFVLEVVSFTGILIFGLSFRGKHPWVCIGLVGLALFLYLISGGALIQMLTTQL